jgi:hypothetical protein
MGIVSLAVGLVFAYAAGAKLLDMPGFIAGVRGYEIVPHRFASLVAGVFVAGESLIGLAHIASIELKLFVLAAIVLLSIFVVTVVNSLVRGEHRPCLCFGAGRDDLVDIYSLIRIALLLAVEVALGYYVIILDGSVSIGGASLYDGIASIAIAILAVLLVAWSLALAKIHRAWRVIRS